MQKQKTSAFITRRLQVPHNYLVSPYATFVSVGSGTFSSLMSRASTLR
jgi:hypothetical protein